jgi:hypothetical protein
VAHHRASTATDMVSGRLLDQVPAKRGDAAASAASCAPRCGSR